MIAGDADASAGADMDSALFAPVVRTKSMRAIGGAVAGRGSGRKWRRQVSSSINDVIWRFSPTLLTTTNTAPPSNVSESGDAAEAEAAGLEEARRRRREKRSKLSSKSKQRLNGSDDTGKSV